MHLKCLIRCILSLSFNNFFVVLDNENSSFCFRNIYEKITTIIDSNMKCFMLFLKVISNKSKDILLK